MGKVRSLIACTSCGHAVGQWTGRCPACRAWGTIEESEPQRRRSGSRAEVLPLASPEGPERRISTGFDGVDRVLGGGIVPGSVVLIAGEPGIGKSTLLLQILAAVGSGRRRCLYASGEESREQVAARARRIGIESDVAGFVQGRDLSAVLDAARAERPDVLVVDSIQAIRDPDQTSLPGGTSQVRLCADALVGLAKADGVAVILAGQVTKDGDVAGPRTLEHAVDAVCSFDGDPRTGLRILVGGKNRFGADGEAAWFEMDGAGLREVDPAGFLSIGSGEAGAAAALVAAGRRGLVVEVQALVAPTDGPVRRNVTGLDPRRFAMVAAVADRATRLRLLRADLYGAASGGLRVDDPGADLAVVAALVSAASGVPPPERTAFCGEISLTGTVRPPANLPARLAAASAAGLQVVVTAGDAGPPRGLRLVRVAHLRDAVSWASDSNRRRGDPSLASAR